jgi:putative FmdB family regulatory protein
MPLYVYKCGSCGFEFEQIERLDKRDDDRNCTECGSVDVTRKIANRFGFSVGLDPKKDTISTNKEIDMVVGEAANKRWERIEKGREARWKGKETTIIDVPKDSKGVYKPMTVVGDSKDKGLRKEFSEALKEHRDERSKKGIKQFDGPGSIEEA